MSSAFAVTTPTKPALPDDVPASFPVRAAAYVAGRLALEDLAALERVDVDLVEDWLDDPAVLAEVDAQVVVQRLSGAEARAGSVALLNQVVGRLQALVAAGEIPASTLVKIGDLAAKVSGIAVERTAPASAGTGFSVNINLGPPQSADKTVRVETQEDIIDV